MPYDDSGNWTGAGPDPMKSYDRQGDYVTPQAITDAGYYSMSPGIITNNPWEISGREYAPGKIGKTYWSLGNDANQIAKAKSSGADVVTIGDQSYLSTSDPNFRTFLPQTPSGTSGFGEFARNGLIPIAAAAAPFVFGPAGADLSGPLAAPSSVSNFLSTVPEAVPGTTLPIGGVSLDITAPGAVEAATAAGNALGPGSGTPSLLPGTADVPGVAPQAVPTPPQAPVAPPPAAPTTVAPQGAQTAPTPISSATAPQVTGSPVGEQGAPGVPGGGTPGLPSPPGEPSIPTPAPAASSPSFVDKALKAVTKNPLTAGAIGVNILSQINARRQGKQLDQQLKAAAAPAAGVANSLIAQGAAGQPSASTAFDINKWVQDTKGAIRQRYANMGRDPNNDSAAAKEIADVDAKAVAMRDAAAQQMTTQGLSAAQIAQGPTTQAAIAAAQQDKDLGASIANTLNALAQLQALSSKGAGATP